MSYIGDIEADRAAAAATIFSFLQANPNVQNMPASALNAPVASAAAAAATAVAQEQNNGSGSGGVIAIAAVAALAVVWFATRRKT